MMTMMKKNMETNRNKNFRKDMMKMKEKFVRMRMTSMMGASMSKKKKKWIAKYSTSTLMRKEMNSVILVMLLNMQVLTMLK